MSDSSNLTFTFWKLLDKYSIEIPIIQRDYAQGRSGSKYSQIRSTFLDDLIKGIESEDGLDLDFVYGLMTGLENEQEAQILKEQVLEKLLNSVTNYAEEIDMEFNYETPKHNKKSNKNLFIPLDGQQRLTTLFLLHYYIALATNELPKYEDVFKKFTYKTRTTSRDFCKALIENKIKYKKEIKSLVAEITNSNWFFKSWEKDPTVSGMLVMLDDIHTKLNSKVDLPQLWNNLINEDKNTIRFKFLDLDTFQKPDELYIKMNARGRALTNFENFKALLEKELENEEGLPEEWKHKLDMDWTDLFWKISDTENIDDTLLTYFNNFALNQFIEITDEIKENTLLTSVINLITDSNEYISKDIYEKMNFFKVDKINEALLILEYLKKKQLDLLDDILNPLGKNYGSSIFKFFIKENSTRYQRVHFFAMSKFLILKNKEIDSYTDADKLELLRWMRVCKNLINNSYIQNPDTYINSIKSIKTISINAFNIYNFLQTEKIVIPFFTTVQRVEEVLKSKLILKNNKWEELFLRFENHNYFDGQLGFILEISKTLNEYDIVLFETNALKSSSIFNKDIIENDKYLFHRAFLTKINYFYDAGNNNLCICFNGNAYREKEENWRKVLRDSSNLLAYKTLLEELDENNVEKSLNKIIVDYKTDSWKTNVVKWPYALQRCDRKMIRISTNHANLLKTTRIYGEHAESNTYTFYKKHVEQKTINYPAFKSEYYYYNPGNVDFPHFNLCDFKYKNISYKISVYFTLNKSYQIEFYSHQTNKINQKLEAALIGIKFYKSSQISNKLFFSTSTESSLLKKIKEISDCLIIIK